MATASVRRALAARDRAVRVGILGAGAMGGSILYQAAATPGVEVVAVADHNPGKAARAAAGIGLAAREALTARDIAAARRAGAVAVSADAMLVAGEAEIDVLVEATSSIRGGLAHVEAAISRGVHVALMNAEIDLIFGSWFQELARANGVICTSADGDQHGVLKGLVDDLAFWGFELEMAGNVKGFLDRRATPETIAREAAKRRLTPRMCAAFTDGTKLSIEMAVLANGVGLAPVRPGMTGPRAARVEEALGLFDIEAMVAEHGPVIDYVLGAEPGGGVFAIARHDHPHQRFMMNYYKMGEGPHYLFYRPYHLCHVECIASVLAPVLFREALLTPDQGFATNVFAYAKRDLRAGETLDGIGGATVYGQVEAVGAAGGSAGGSAGARGHPGLPVCLAEDVRLVRDLAADAPIAMADIEIPAGRADFAAFEKARNASRRLGAAA